GLRIITSNAKHLLELVNDVLDFSKIEASLMSIRKSLVTTDSFVTELVAMNSAKATARGLKLVVDTSARVPEMMETDPLRLRQVVRNLLSNAIKFTEEGKNVTLRVASRIDADRGWLVIEVQDEGPGIPRERAEEIFKPFTQLDSQDTRRHEGTGL